MKLSSSGINELSRDTPLGTVQTGKVVQVYNENNIKYTFKVYEPSNANSVINMIVVDMGDQIIEYFIQYIFNDKEAHPKLDSGIIDMSVFTGSMIVYNNVGTQIGTFGFTDGINTDADGSTDPCDEVGWDFGNDDDNTPTGGGSPPASDDSGVDNDYNEGSGGSSGGNNETIDTADCGLGWGYESCGCPTGPLDGHEITGNPCCNGSPLVVTNTCTGQSWSSRSGNSVAKEGDDPCFGDAGVLLDSEEIEEKKDAIETCLGDLYNSQWFDEASYTDIMQIEDFLSGNCSEYSKNVVLEFKEIKDVLPLAKFNRYEELLDFIEYDPWILIQDCDEQNGLDTSNYLDLYNLPFPQECSDKLFNMGTGWHHQPITDGNVPLANIDYYGVEVTNYPDFNSDGNVDSEAEMYQSFREKFTDIASGEIEDFQFSCDVNFDGDIDSDDIGNLGWEFEPFTDQDGIDFVSNDPIASILMIEAETDIDGIIFEGVATDDGAVIVSDFTSNDWTISTIMTPNNGTQPFSGNRQWGWLINENGNFEFFTRAVDVANISKLLNYLPGGANSECQQETLYDIAEATWENMQQEIVDWINSQESNGGQALIVSKTARRIDRNQRIIDK